MSGPYSSEKSRSTEQRLGTLVNNLGGLALDANGVLQYPGPNGSTLTVGRQIFFTTADSGNVASLTPAAITGLSGIHVAAIQYLVRGTIIVKQGTVTATQGIQFTGPTLNSMDVSAFTVEGAATLSSQVTTGLLSTISTGAVPGSTIAELHFDGIIDFNVSGTGFGLEALCVTSATDTWVVGRHSYIELVPVS